MTSDIGDILYAEKAFIGHALPFVAVADPIGAFDILAVAHSEFMGGRILILIAEEAFIAASALYFDPDFSQILPVHSAAAAAIRDRTLALYSDFPIKTTRVHGQTTLLNDLCRCKSWMIFGAIVYGLLPILPRSS